MAESMARAKARAKALFRNLAGVDPRLQRNKVVNLGLAIERLDSGRDGGIRTHDLPLPKRTRYQAAPHPVRREVYWQDSWAPSSGEV